MKDINKELAQSLLSNAHDFILSAVEQANSTENNKWKYAILNLAAGIELALKAKLAIEHWSLLFDKVDNASIEKLKSGDFNSANFATSIGRLEKISKVCLSKTLKDNFENTRIIRNRLIHFHLNLNERNVKSVVTAGANSFIEFYDEFLVNTDIGDKTLGHNLSKRLLKLKEFVSARITSLKSQLEISNRPRTWYFFECPSCLQDATVLTKHKAKCLFCGSEDFLRDIAVLISMNGTVELCPNCKETSVVLHSSEKDYWECICCGYYRGAPRQWVGVEGNLLPHLRY